MEETVSFLILVPAVCIAHTTSPSTEYQWNSFGSTSDLTSEYTQNAAPLIPTICFTSPFLYM